MLLLLRLRSPTRLLRLLQAAEQETETTPVTEPAVSVVIDLSHNDDGDAEDDDVLSTSIDLTRVNDDVQPTRLSANIDLAGSDDDEEEQDQKRRRILVY